ncbi:TetR family transcriptional regulator [Paenibacillus silvae]|uniref:TetR family transcriptional regulator n=1 Tax=Paenibacillus silvae TaxID=1325358 RepID=A0A2W6NLU8_9BACL|nr:MULTISPECIES: TetR family transcriptional regulator [Paenibacillus]MCK6077133.1 TetR family transcriptional regulator [Paenibacillus silvae]MCK6151331.1 TetR family transcriptional regulator [Paenibacillus silvae]MCK6269819.1 TetR family transcriptional regulator [Paenibacillus silvae]PZT56751.1 TetR/AcrR family transcriptional regulator [Paenibacillus silvae]GGH63337.1 TetR family transcriptional regulator [Paenibacillus silvae]
MTEPELDIKTRILLAAKKLFALQGYDGTSVRQICDEAGANVSLVSYHFGGKEKVFDALFEHFFPEHILSMLAAESMSPIEGIRRIVGEVVRFTMTDREMSDIVQLEITLRTHRTTTVFQYLDPVWNKVKEYLQQGKDQGLFKIESASYAMLQVMGAALAHKRAKHSRFGFDYEDMNTEELAEQTVEFVLRGLGVNSHE